MNMDRSYHFTVCVLALGNKPVEPDAGAAASGPEPQPGPERIVRMIESGETDWNRFVLTGSNNYVLQALYLKFHEHGLLGYLPPDLSAHLKDLYEINLERNLTILEHTRQINDLLRSHGITPIFMKGIGNILDGLYSSPGERMMLDIDILADPDRMEEAARVLIDDGFTSAGQYDPGRKEAMKHFPELIKQGLPAFVDIHRMPVNIQFRTLFNYETVTGDTRPARDDPRFTVMSDALKIKLNFIHSQMVHWGHYHARPSLRDLYDLFLLSGREDPGKIFASFTPYRGKAAGYLRVLYDTFGITRELPGELKGKGRRYLLRHRLAMRNPRSGRVIFTLLRAVRLYVTIPIRSLFDKDYRLYVRVRLNDPEWYRRNLSIRKFVKKNIRKDRLP